MRLLEVPGDGVQALLQAAPDAMFAVAPDGRVLAANDAAAEMFGYSTGELAALGVDALVPERLRHRHPEHRAGYFEAPRRRPMGLGIVLYGLRRDGSEFPVEISLSTLGQGREAITIAAVRDVGERTEALEAGVRAERQALVVELGRAALLTDDVDELLTRALTLMADTLQLPIGGVLEPVGEGDALEIRATVGLDQDLRGRVLMGAGNPAATAFAERRTVAIEDVRAEPAYAGERLLEETAVRCALAAPMLAPDGPLGVVGMAARFPRIITSEDRVFVEAVANVLAAALQQHAAHAETDATAARLQMIIDNAPTPIYLKDTEGRYVLGNREFARVVGRPHGELGFTDADILAAAAEGVVRASDGEVMRQLRALEFEEIVTIQDEVRTFISVKFPWLATDGGLLGVGGISTDISDRARAERERAELQERVRQSERMESVGQLAGGIAHDFNNLLAVIGNFADFVASELPPESQLADDVGQIQRAAERAAELTRRLLVFSRRQIAHPRVLHVPVVVRDVQRLLGRTIEEHVRLRLDVPETTRPVRMDPGELEQVIVNLALNARDAMPNGGELVIRTENIERDADWAHARGAPSLHGEIVRLSVTDQGAGMPVDVIRRAFEPFFTTKPSGRGTGLGLATVYGIVTGVGGHAEIYSEPGHGTEVKVYLPAARADTGAAASSPASETALGGGETVLVVEDEPAVRELTRRILADAGYTVLTAGGVQEALAQMNTADSIDLLLTDLVMPDGSGREIASVLRERRRALGVVFCSGYTDDRALREGTPEEAVTFVEKPFSARRLLDAVAEELRRAA